MLSTASNAASQKKARKNIFWQKESPDDQGRRGKEKRVSRSTSAPWKFQFPRLSGKIVAKIWARQHFLMCPARAAEDPNDPVPKSLFVCQNEPNDETGGELSSSITGMKAHQPTTRYLFQYSIPTNAVNPALEISRAGSRGWG